MNTDIQIISIEGNIGSGKSTFIEHLKKYYKNNQCILFLKEPVDDWMKITDNQGVSILEKFYADQHKYAFSFQMMAYITRLNTLRDIIKNIKSAYINNETHEKGVNNKIVIITERTLYTDKFVFAKMLYESGKIEEVNYQIYLKWFNTFAEEFPIHKLVYIKTNPDECYSRISNRNRDGETNISIDYLRSCNTYHDNMLDTTLDECVCKNQLILDGNINIHDNINIIDYWLSSINSFIYS